MGIHVNDAKKYKIHNLNQLKLAISQVWDQLPTEKVRAACDSFEKRLKLVKRQNGGVIKSFL